MKRIYLILLGLVMSFAGYGIGPITGATMLCRGVSTTLTDATTGGTWLSSNTAVASFGTSGGYVTAVSAGTAMVTYVVGASIATALVTVFQSPATITGPTSLCSGSSVTLTEDSTAGAWSTLTGSAASVGTSGIVTGLFAGSAAITYTLFSTGCNALHTVTVLASPSSISGYPFICTGNSVLLTDPTPGGTWYSSNTSVATVAGVSTTVNVFGVSAGSAVISYSLGACQSVFPVTVNASPAPLSGASSVCTGASITLTETVTGGTWISSNTTVGTVAGGSVTGVSAGTVSISYMVSGGCVVTKTITVNTSPVAIISPSTLCNGSVDTVTDTSEGGTWSCGSYAVVTGSATSAPVTGIAPGVATISYTLAGGCRATATLSVLASPMSIAGVGAVCDGNTGVLTEGTSGGSWNSSNTYVATVTGTSVAHVTGVSAGTAVISYTIGDGCFSLITMMVNDNPGAITGASGICVSSSTTLNDPSPGGTWYSSAPGIAGVNASTGMVTGISAGTAFISYVLSTGCLTESAVTINPTPTAISGPTSICNGGTTTLGDGLPGGLWSSSDITIAVIGSSSGMISGLTIGTVVTTYTTSCGSITRPFTVNISPAPIGGANSVCAGSSVYVTDTTFGGTWSTSSTTVLHVGSISGAVTGMSVGTGVVTYALSTGCKAITYVTVNPTPNTITGPAGVCMGATVNLRDALSGGSWSSGNPSIATIGSSTGTVTGVSVGSATITYTAAGFCSTYSAITVLVTPDPIYGISSVCTGASNTLFDSVSGGFWSTSSTAITTIGSTSGVFRGVSPGTASITYSLVTGCLVSTIATVNPLPAAISGPSAGCTGGSISLIDGTSGGGWSSSASLIAAVGTSGSVLGVSPGTATLYYTLSATGCYVTKNLTIYASPSVITGPTAVCQNASVFLTDSVSGGVWTCPGSTAAINLSGNLTGISAGTAIITYAVAGICLSTYVVTVNPLSAIVGPGFVCTSSPIGYNPSIAGGVWSSYSSIIYIDSLAGDVYGVLPGSAIITYTLPTGCISTKTLNVFNSPDPIIGSPAICEGTVAYLYDTTSPGGTWYSGSPLIATINAVTGQINGIGTGLATISYVLPTGCMSTELIEINPLPSPISGPSTACVGVVSNLLDTAYGGSWYSGNTGIATIDTFGDLEGVSSGSVVITYLVNYSGCYRTTTITVNALTPAITGSSQVCAGSSTTLHDTIPGGTWSSSNISVASVGSTGVLTGVTTGTLTVTYIPATGCAATKSILVNPVPSAILGSDHVCLLSTIDIIDTTHGGAWSSSSFGLTIGSSTGEVTGMSYGTFTASYTLSSGCYATSNIAVDSLPYPFTVSGSGSYCAGGIGVHVMLDGSMAADNYSVYFAGAPLDTLSGTTLGLDFGLFTLGGTYTVRAVNRTTGCTNTMSSNAVITVNPIPMVDTLTGGGSYCEGGSGVSIHLSGSTTGVQYQLFVDTTLVTSDVGSGGGLTFGSVRAAGTYSVVAQYVLSGCASEMFGNPVITIIPTVIPSISISATPGDTVCAGTAVTFTATPLNGGTTPVFQWSVNGTSEGTDTTIYHYTPANGDVVRVRLTSNATCASPVDTAVEKVVVVNQYPAQITGDSSVCVGSVVTLTDSTTEGTWVSSDPSVALVATIGIVTGGVVGIVPGTSIITYDPGTGCIRSIALTVLPLPSITATKVADSCGGKYAFTAGGGVNYLWSPSIGLSCDTCNVTLCNPSTIGVYQVTGTSAIGCSDTASVVVNPNRISGHVSFTGSTPAVTDMMVWLLQYNPADSSLAGIDSTLTCADGGMPYYEFMGKSNGYYLVTGRMVTQNPDGAGYVPTYGLSDPHWNTANTIYHTGSFDTMHINMVYGNVLPGTGAISGYIHSGVNVPVNGMLVFLVDATGNQILTYTYTDPYGYYSFNSLAPGIYNVYPEEFDYYTTQSANISLGNSSFMNYIDFEQIVSSRIIIPAITNSVSAQQSNVSISCFPNPTSGTLCIQWDNQAAGEAKIDVTDVTGHKVYSSGLTISSASGKKNIDISQLKNGVYFLNIRSGTMDYHCQVVLDK